MRLYPFPYDSFCYLCHKYKSPFDKIGSKTDEISITYHIIEHYAGSDDADDGYKC